MHHIFKVGTRGYGVQFDELLATEFATTTNVYVLQREQSILVFDTFLGSQGMEEMIRELNLEGKPVIVVNSHSDWDHVWGNGYFAGARIIAHRSFSEALQRRRDSDLATYGQYVMGEANPLLPTEVFEESLELGEGMQLIHTPGHTADSITLWDSRDKILYVGDNAEDPIPSCIDLKNIEAHRKTLERYLTFDFRWIAPGHGNIFQRKVLEENLNYLKHWKDIKYEAPPYRKNHLENLKLNEENE